MPPVCKTLETTSSTGGARITSVRRHVWRRLWSTGCSGRRVSLYSAGVSILPRGGSQGFSTSNIVSGVGRAAIYDNDHIHLSTPNFGHVVSGWERFPRLVQELFTLQDMHERPDRRTDCPGLCIMTTSTTTVNALPESIIILCSPCETEIGENCA